MAQKKAKSKIEVTQCLIRLSNVYLTFNANLHANCKYDWLLQLSVATAYLLISMTARAMHFASCNNNRTMFTCKARHEVVLKDNLILFV